MGSEEFSHLLRVFFHFSSLFFVFFFFSFFFVFLRFSASAQGQTTAIYCKNGEFHSDPVCTDPVRNFPNSVVEPHPVIKRVNCHPLDYGGMSS